ncbi:HNH endonuclease [Lacticaseibacillus paracasei]|uniref:NUMOD4 domain-containing protein n=1 Tax=Lacticaseibacillus paracasei TaxID=1597 RepID=UPI00237F6FAF|nr:NUMOD4 domain-containing protein [Lacticaseibacillus paracasei]MDE3290425.1 HNH endonuclease [Lacticaseibacillus paracasei]
MSEKEIWKDIEDYKGLYQVSNLGRVRSLERVDSNGHYVKEKVLASFPNRNGYFKVNLYRDRNIKQVSIHRLVAAAFLDNPDNLPEVNHIDEDKSNNAVSNLEYCTVMYNNTYGTRLERVAKALECPICAITSSGQRHYFDSVNEAARVLGLKRQGITNCLHGRRKHHGGFSFELAV